MIITIDGPTASGKSTIARLLAKELHSYYLYTGLLYRGLAYLLMKKYGYTLETVAHPDMKHVDQILQKNEFVYRYDPEYYERIFYMDKDITPHLQDDIVGQAASILSTNPAVRERLNELQREIADDHAIVIDGRDSGSVVFPHAEKKFFLTASVDARARRLIKRHEKGDGKMSLEEAKQYISIRDDRDSQRKIAPLTVPQGAHVIDNSDTSIQETLHLVKTFL